LYSEAFLRALEESLGRLETTSLAEYIRFYTSRAHRDSPEAGCVLPTLAPEIGRGSEAMRQTFAEGLEMLLARVEEHLPRAEALTLLSTLVGAMLLARAVGDAGLSDEILRQARHKLLREYGGSDD